MCGVICSDDLVPHAFYAEVAYTLLMGYGLVETRECAVYKKYMIVWDALPTCEQWVKWAVSLHRQAVGCGYTCFAQFRFHTEGGRYYAEVGMK